jgi:hypothetical protein
VYPAPVCVSTSTITDEFNSNAIKSGIYIWFNSAFDPATMAGRTAFYVKNSKITFTANNVNYTLTVPDSRIRFEANVTTASTDFVNNIWETVVPLNYSGNVFLTGLSYLVPANLPGSIKNIKWTADISSDRAGTSMKWKWAAAVYTTFSTNTGVDVKPVDGQIAVLDEAGTPLNYRPYVVPGATGGGLLTVSFIGNLLNLDLLNFTGDYSASATVGCSANSMVSRSPVQEEEVTITEKEEVKSFEVKAMPNPSSNYFTLVLSGGDDSPVTIRVVDMSGRVMDQYQKLAPNTLLRIGEKWRNGIYIAEIIQGGQRKTIKLVKLN